MEEDLQLYAQGQHYTIRLGDLVVEVRTSWGLEGRYVFDSPAPAAAAARQLASQAKHTKTASAVEAVTRAWARYWGQVSRKEQ